MLSKLKEPGALAITLAAAGIQGGGKLDLKGAFTPQPLSVRTSVDLSGLNVASFAPYFASSLNATVRAITLGAAYTLHMDHLVGSIEVGKHADFCVLRDDPLAVPPQGLKDIDVLGTVIGGRPLTPRAA